MYNKKPSDTNFFQLTEQAQQEILQPLCVVFAYLLQLRRNVDTSSWKYHVLLIRPSVKIFVDALLPNFFNDKSLLKKNVLYPNSNWISRTIYIGSQLEQFPWLPNLSREGLQWVWKNVPLKEILEKTLQLTGSKELEVYILKNKTEICILNYMTKDCVVSISIDGNKKMTITYGKKNYSAIEFKAII